MSDIEGKDFNEQVVEKVNPESLKTIREQVSKNVTDGADEAAATIQPESKKSAIKDDHGCSGVDSEEKAGKTVLEVAQETAGGIAGAASEKIKAVADYVTGANSKDAGKNADDTTD